MSEEFVAIGYVGLGYKGLGKLRQHRRLLFELL